MGNDNKGEKKKRNVEGAADRRERGDQQAGGGLEDTHQVGESLLRRPRPARIHLHPHHFGPVLSGPPGDTHQPGVRTRTNYITEKENVRTFAAQEH